MIASLLGTGAAAALVLMAPSEASAASCAPSTVPAYPADGATVAGSDALIVYPSVCFDWPADPAMDGWSVGSVAELRVDVDGEPASLVPYAPDALGMMWRLEPRPAIGATVTVRPCAGYVVGGCDEEAGPTEEPDAPVWTFTIGPDRTNTAPLHAPEIVEFSGREVPAEEAFFGERQWTLSLARSDSDSGEPMAMEVELDAGGTRLLTWTHPDRTEQTLTFYGSDETEACVTVRTFDLEGNPGPTASECASLGEDAEPLVGGCSVGGGAPAPVWAVSLLVLVAIRFRH